MKNIDRIKQMNKEELAELLCLDTCESHCLYGIDEDCSGSCIKGIKKWLEQEATIQLTDAEKVILSNIDKKYKWIARDNKNSENLHLYVEKPINKNELEWYDARYTDFGCYDHLFQFIQWGDEEPYEISKLLEK